jgi:hypothetical protein
MPSTSTILHRSNASGIVTKYGLIAAGFVRFAPFTNLQSSFFWDSLSQEKNRRVERMHSKYSGRTTIVTLAGMTALGWAGVALTVQMVMRILA